MAAEERNPSHRQALTDHEPVLERLAAVYLSLERMLELPLKPPVDEVYKSVTVMNEVVSRRCRQCRVSVYGRMLVGDVVKESPH